jgi:hypothetical protein
MAAPAPASASAPVVGLDELPPAESLDELDKDAELEAALKDAPSFWSTDGYDSDLERKKVIDEQEAYLKWCDIPENAEHKDKKYYLAPERIEQLAKLRRYRVLRKEQYLRENFQINREEKDEEPVYQKVQLSFGPNDPREQHVPVVKTISVRAASISKVILAAITMERTGRSDNREQLETRVLECTLNEVPNKIAHLLVEYMEYHDGIAFELPTMQHHTREWSAYHVSTFDSDFVQRVMDLHLLYDVLMAAFRLNMQVLTHLCAVKYSMVINTHMPKGKVEFQPVRSKRRSKRARRMPTAKKAMAEAVGGGSDRPARPAAAAAADAKEEEAEAEEEDDNDDDDPNATTEEEITPECKKLILEALLSIDPPPPNKSA